MKTLLLVFSIELNKKFRLFDHKLSKEHNFIIEFINCDRKDIHDITQYLEKRDIYTSFRYLDLYNITINEVLKFNDKNFKLYKYDEENFEINHGFINLEFNEIKFKNFEALKETYNFIKNEYKKYIEDHPIESINDLKLDYRSDEDRISKLINEKFHELSFHVSIFKIIYSEIDKLKTELLEVIESKFKEIETRINKYF